MVKFTDSPDLHTGEFCFISELFGANLRGTAATTIPNMVRGTVVGMTAMFGFIKPSYGVVYAGASVGLLCFLLCFLAISTISETHNRDLDFLEE